MRSFVRMVPVVAMMVLLPSLAFAQGTLTGVVRDASGGVLPGVTVEAASPALTEKVRTAVTDGSGQYRLIDLTPGTYSLTVTLPGFSTVKREGIVLAGSATVAIPIELRVGGLEETITVTGETPVVDVQSVRRETVLSSDTIAAIPATRTVGSLLNATPGLTVDNNGVAVTPTMTFFSARGGQTNEGRMAVNGMTVAATFNGGGVSSYILDTANVDEVSVVVSGGLGESDTGGPTMNLVPKGGGNSFSGQAFINEAGDWSRSSNIDAALRAVGLTDPPGIIKAYDGSVSYGGPVKRDKLWFFGSYRKLNTETNVEGIVANANAFDMSKWLWAADESVKARASQGRTMYIGRVTAQPTPKHRFSFNHEYQVRCEGTPLKVETTDGCHSRPAGWIAAGAATTSPEAHTAYFDMPYYVTQATWSAPMTSKLLLESGYTRFSYYHAGGPGQIPPDGIFAIGVTEQSTAVNPATQRPYVPRANYIYRALSNYADNYGQSNNWRASASYVTGAHSVKVGYQGQLLRNDTLQKINPSGLSYTFNQGVPVSFTMRLPEWGNAERTATSAAFVQDTWTRGRITMQGALRFDRAWSWSPADGNGTTATSPTNLAPITFGRTISVDAFNDLTPRFGVAWDVFGNGKTALKFSGGHYLDAATNEGPFVRNNLASAFNAATGTGRIVTQVTRNWSDTDGDRVVDCDLLNFGLQNTQDTCAALAGDNLNFGRSGGNVTQVNQDTLKGWGVRENDWQYGVTVQQQIVPRVSVEVGYAHRSFYGFTVTDNLVRDPSQHDAWTITAPTDSRLPGGGGYPITLYTPTVAGAGAARNYVTFESDFGAERKNYYDGVDVTLNGRLRQGLTFQIGTQTGRTVLDTCAVDTKVDTPDPRFCRNAAPVLTTVRGLASYTVPKIDVQVSATFRSQPPLELGIADTSVGPTANGATWNVPNAVVQGLLGRLPPGALLGGTTPVRILDDQHRLFVGGRRNQVDMRIAKIIRLGRTRLDAGLDLNNLFNTNYATAYQSTYQFDSPAPGDENGGSWLNPTSVYTPRYVRLNLTASF